MHSIHHIYFTDDCWLYQMKMCVCTFLLLKPQYNTVSPQYWPLGFLVKNIVIFDLIEKLSVLTESKLDKLQGEDPGTIARFSPLGVCCEKDLWLLNDVFVWIKVSLSCRRWTLVCCIYSLNKLLPSLSSVLCPILNCIWFSGESARPPPMDS